MLLNQGRIRPTREAVMVYHNKSKMAVDSAKRHVLTAITDLYWAAIDVSHAALMNIGQSPPSPFHVADMIEEYFIKPKHIDKKYGAIVRNFYKLSKMISYREIKEITGQEYDQHLEDVSNFIKIMEKFVK